MRWTGGNGRGGKVWEICLVYGFDLFCLVQVMQEMMEEGVEVGRGKNSGEREPR